MKKAFALLLVSISLQAFAFPIFTIINKSWSDTIPYGSSQWIDVKADLKNGYTSSDSANIYIFNSAKQGSGSPIYKAIIRMTFIKHVDYNSIWIPGSPGYWENTPIDSTGFQSLPLNTDGSTRIYFTMPTAFPSGKFSVNVMLGIDVHGTFPSLTGIDPIYESPKMIKQINAYNLLGQLITIPDGIYIREIIYTDATIERRKAYGIPTSR